MPFFPLWARSLPRERTGRLFCILKIGLTASGMMAVISTMSLAQVPAAEKNPDPPPPSGEDGWVRSLAVSFSTQGGNTNLSSYALAFTADYLGDLEVGGLNLADNEVQLSLSHKRGRLDGELYEDDGIASFLFDVMAHGGFSPFFLSFWAYDSTTSLDQRIQLGAGAKYRVDGGFSVSLAYLWEVERYQGQPVTRQYRMSLRPKYKRTLAHGVSVNSTVFLQPLVQDPSRFLVDGQVTVTVPTLVKLLSEGKQLDLTLGWREQYNSRPPGSIKKRDTDLNIGVRITF